jgi:DNA invertase Pin-like site-specific DNA recombinase
MSDFAVYVRVSTDGQATGEQSQRDAIEQFLNDHDVDDADWYADIDRSGSDNERDGFTDLAEAVENGEYTDVVMPELSRLARHTATSVEFIDNAVEQDVLIHLLDDMIDRIDPERPQTQFFGKMISLWMEEERKQTIRRIKRGLSQAQQQGKWTGRPPKGFETDDNGFLQVDMEEYLAIRDALERVDDGESLRSVASDTRFNRQTLSDLYQDRCEWYLSAEANNEDDERVRKALEQVDG